jgi:hypothetical protein
VRHVITHAAQQKLLIGFIDGTLARAARFYRRRNGNIRRLRRDNMSIGTIILIILIIALLGGFSGIGGGPFYGTGYYGGGGLGLVIVILLILLLLGRL